MDRPDLLLNNMFHFSPEISINLTKMKNRDYYPYKTKNQLSWRLILNGKETWKLIKHLWKPFFTRVKSVCKDNKLREFYFKLLHSNRIVVTKKELFLFGKTEETKCPYCEMNDSIIHTFHSCNWNQSFFVEVIKWFNKENVTFFSLSPTELLFGMRADASSKESNIIWKLNFTILYTKYYLYNQKLIHGELSVNEFELPK